jgi:hypothetical protein
MFHLIRTDLMEQDSDKIGGDVEVTPRVVV